VRRHPSFEVSPGGGESPRPKPFYEKTIPFDSMEPLAKLFSDEMTTGISHLTIASRVAFSRFSDFCKWLNVF
jgi:hypothetical protein